MLFLKLLNNRNKERIICMKIELLKGKEIAIVSSNEKIITDALPFTAALRANVSANAVFPIAGLAARMIRSDF